MKRGVSPLLATVLLIGLVIVLAALIIKFGGELTNRELEEVEFQQDKSILLDVEFDVTTVDIVNQKTMMTITNNEANYLDSFLVRVDGELVDCGNLAIPGFNTEVVTCFFYSSVDSCPSEAEFIPQLMIDGELTSLTLSIQEDTEFSCGDEEDDEFIATLHVDALDELHEQNELLIGDNIHWVFSNEGLDEDNNTIQDFYDLSFYAKDADLKLLRFPGGSIADAYHWKNHIGPVENRVSGNPQGNPNGYIPKGLIGTDEFMRFIDLVGAEAIFVANFGTGTPDEAADWVEYLNAPDDGTNPRGGIDWAAKRAENGHPEPYGVTYFEIGNEIYADMKPNTFFGHVGANEYATRFNEFVTAMKEVDPTILTGAVGYGPNQVSPQDEERGNDQTLWNQEILAIAGGNIDFFIEHSYAYGEAKDVMVSQGLYTEDNINEIAQFGLAYVFYQLDTLDLLQEEIGNQPIAITEHGSPFSSDYLSGLLMGSYLIESLKREDILLAPSFNLHEMYPHDSVGVIYGHILVNQDAVLESIPYPAYYALKAFGQYTGDVILTSIVQSPTYDVSPFIVYPGREDVPLVSVLASKSSGVLYLAILNRDLERGVTLDITLDNFEVSSGNVHQLYNGELWENNEGALNVELKTFNVDVSGSEFTLTLPKHSLSIVELR